MIELSKENPNKVIETKELNRYYIKIDDINVEDICRFRLDDLHEEVKIVIHPKCYNYGNLDNYNDGKEIFDNAKSWEEAKDSYQKHFDRKFGKDVYKVYCLNVFDHSGQSFTISDSSSHGWDLYCIGMIAVDTDNCEENIKRYANDLDCIWNGFFTDIKVYDRFNEEYVESEVSEDMKTTEELTKSYMETYHTDEVHKAK